MPAIPGMPPARFFIWLASSSSTRRDASFTAAAILIRAVESLDGIELMQLHGKTIRLVDLTRGPGRLAKAKRLIAEQHWENRKTQKPFRVDYEVYNGQFVK